jgi:hypothetical protein
MTAAIVLVSAFIVALILLEALRSRAGNRQPVPSPRFSGRLVGAVPQVATITPRRRRSGGLRNGVRISAVRNGRAVTPPDAIGLGCLQPISECTLGDRCICLNQDERQDGGHL